MSDFFEKTENQRLLQKIELKQNSGMSIKKDTIQLIASAFDSMTDEDWIEYDQQKTQSDRLFKQYYPVISPIPAAALRQLVEKIPAIIEDIRIQRTEYLETAFCYELTFTTVVAEIANQNDIVHQYTDDMDKQDEIDRIALTEPTSFVEWQQNMNQFCHNYLNAEPDKLGYWLLILFLHSAFMSTQ